MLLKSFLLFCLLSISTLNVFAQGDCYSITVKGSTICNPKLKWSNVKISASKDALIKFLETNDLLHSCNVLLLSREQLTSKFEKADCPPGIIKIEFEDPKDVLQLYDEMKEEKQKKAAAETADKAKTGTEAPGKKERGGEAEICINSSGEVSLSFGNEYGSIQVSSKGKFSISTKNGDKEYKTSF